MKKSLFFGFILCGILCGISGILFLCHFIPSVPFTGAFGVFCACILISAVCAVFFSKFATENIKKTVNYFSQDNYENATDFNCDEEFKPFFNLLSKQNKLINEHIFKLKTERNTIKAITDNMREGFILFNSSLEILTFNKSAVVFLNSQNVVFDTDRLITLNDNSPLYKSAKQALDGTCDYFTTEVASKVFQIYANPVIDENKKVFGVVVLCVDITQNSNIENAKRDFTVNVSHELKTPLTSISGYAEMLANGMVENREDIIKFSGIIYKETARLIKLTSDIVRLSEIESNLLPDNDEKIELYSLFESTMETLTLTADKYKVSLINMLFSPLYITANRSLIEELVFNLCENAIKYNKPGGSVTLSAVKSADFVEITVSDTGIGIPEDQLENIFNRFWRVDKSRSKSTGGTGLGLSIVKQIAEYYSGTVDAKSQLGKGTAITVKLYPDIEH
ncbi:MAG: hypothetical protein E7588_07525 [Ruminococcaceae bacterium]|nr:hypothetical protein [Oscillospiraceae bacterium]